VNQASLPSNNNGKETKTKKGSKSSSLAKTNSLKLECIEGIHKGAIVVLSGELIVGQDPTGGTRSRSNSKKQVFQVDDDGASKLHAKLVLNKSGSKKKSLLTVRVTDLKSKNGTFVNGKKVSGSGKQAFVNDKIKVGGCVFSIKHI